MFQVVRITVAQRNSKQTTVSVPVRGMASSFRASMVKSLLDTPCSCDSVSPKGGHLVTAATATVLS